MQETIYRLGAPALIALLADTHNCRPEPILRSLDRHRPELIVIAGDIAAGRRPDRGLILEHEKNILPLLRGCAETAPTFLSLGNHEYLLCGEDLELIRSTGVTLLDNDWRPWHGFFIGGLTSPKTHFYRRCRAALGGGERYPFLDRRRLAELPEGPAILESQGMPELSWLPELEAQPGWKLLLAHEPHLWERCLRDRKLDLILSGHAHGGQWRFFGHGVYAPNQGFFPRYTAGVYGNMLVSRGLSNSAAPIPRLGNPTELVYITP